MKLTCKICNCDVEATAFGMHLKHKHKIVSEEYYKAYVKNTSGICRCGKPLKFMGVLRGYKHYCSPKCARNAPEQIKKRETTCLQKYGVKCSFAAEEAKIKKEFTCEKRYGDAFPQRTAEIKNKSKRTCARKYNKEFFVQTDAFKETMKRRCLAKSDGQYEWPSQFPDVAKRRSETFMQNTTWRDNFINACMNKYGVENPMQVSEIRKRAQHKYTYNELNFDSAAELAYFIWLIDNDAHFEYQPEISFAYTYNGKTHMYHPDFMVENAFVEIKGAHFFEDGKMINPYDRTQDGLYEAKHQCMIDNSVKIITDYDEYIRYVNDKYTKNYLSAFKNN